MPSEHTSEHYTILYNMYQKAEATIARQLAELDQLRKEVEQLREYQRQIEDSQTRWQPEKRG